MTTSTAPTRLSRQLIIVVLGTVLLLLLPWLAMRFTGSVAWDGFDFAVAATLLLATGMLYVWASRRVRTVRAKWVAVLLLAAALAIVWAELAVGVFGTPFAGS